MNTRLIIFLHLILLAVLSVKYENIAEDIVIPFQQHYKLLGENEILREYNFISTPKIGPFSALYKAQKIGQKTQAYEDYKLRRSSIEEFQTYTIKIITEESMSSEKDFYFCKKYEEQAKLAEANIGIMTFENRFEVLLYADDKEESVDSKDAKKELEKTLYCVVIMKEAIQDLGKPLFEHRLQASGNQNKASEVLSIINQMTSLVFNLNKQKLFHNDVKLSNFLLFKDENGYPLVKLSDFDLLLDYRQLKPWTRSTGRSRPKSKNIPLLSAELDVRSLILTSMIRDKQMLVQSIAELISINRSVMQEEVIDSSWASNIDDMYASLSEDLDKLVAKSEL